MLRCPGSWSRSESPLEEQRRAEIGSRTAAPSLAAPRSLPPSFPPALLTHRVACTPPTPASPACSEQAFGKEHGRPAAHDDLRTWGGYRRYRRAKRRLDRAAKGGGEGGDGGDDDDDAAAAAELSSLARLSKGGGGGGGGGGDAGPSGSGGAGAGPGGGVPGEDDDAAAALAPTMSSLGLDDGDEATDGCQVVPPPPPPPLFPAPPRLASPRLTPPPQPPSTPLTPTLRTSRLSSQVSEDIRAPTMPKGARHRFNQDPKACIKWLTGSEVIIAPLPLPSPSPPHPERRTSMWFHI